MVCSFQITKDSSVVHCYLTHNCGLPKHRLICSVLTRYLSLKQPQTWGVPCLLLPLYSSFHPHLKTPLRLIQFKAHFSLHPFCPRLIFINCVHVILKSVIADQVAIVWGTLWQKTNLFCKTSLKCVIVLCLNQNRAGGLCCKLVYQLLSAHRQSRWHQRIFTVNWEMQKNAGMQLWLVKWLTLIISVMAPVRKWAELSCK